MQQIVIFTMLFLLSFNSFCQDSVLCSKYIHRKFDQVTGETTVYGELILPSSDGSKKVPFIDLILPDDKKCIILAFLAGSCIDEKNKIYFLFTDSTRLSVISNSSFNCKGYSTLYLGGTLFGRLQELEELKIKDVKTIRIMTRDSYVQKSLTSTQAKQLRMSISCLSNMIQ